MQYTQTHAGDKTLYTSVDEIEKDDGKDPEIYPQEFRNTATPNGMLTHLLNLKVSVVILLRNLNHTIGLCNAPRLIVKRLLKHKILAEIKGKQFLSIEMILIPMKIFHLL